MKKKIKFIVVLFGATLILNSHHLVTYATNKETKNNKITKNKEEQKTDLLVTNYYNLRAEKEVYELDKDILEEKEEKSLISKTEYNKQKSLIDSQKDNIELEIDETWKQLNELGYYSNIQNENKTEKKDFTTLKNELITLNKQKDVVKKQKEELKNKYISGKYTKKDFIKKYSPLEKQDYELNLKIKPIVKAISCQKKSYWKNYK
ncbi:MAG: hypothetical protein KIC92_01205 [Clostridiales bacterium]|nr:hypothetical protein [Clostridiales bacterium]